MLVLGKVSIKRIRDDTVIIGSESVGILIGIEVSGQLLLGPLVGNRLQTHVIHDLVQLVV